MNKSESESFVAYLRAKPEEASSLARCEVRHRSGARGKVVRAEIENGICYLICRFSAGAFARLELSFNVDSLRDGDIHLPSVPEDLVSRYSNWKKWYESSLALEKAEALRRLATVKSEKHLPLLLPERLQNFIAEQVGWKYSPKRNQYGLTDGVSLTDYMGTYFPRSFAEAYFFSAVMLQKPHIAESLLDRSSVSIVDIGSGTGGNILGFLWAIRDHCIVSDIPFPVVITTSFDKSTEALDIQSRLISMFFRHHVTIEPELLDCQSGKAFFRHVNQRLCSNGPVDVMMCWKSICEFYRTQSSYDQNVGMYKEFLGLGHQYLKRNGVVALCDVTNLPYDGHRSFLPCIINDEIHDLLRQKNTDLVPIFPLSCAHWHQECTGYADCFIQKNVAVTHSALPEGKISDRQGVFLKIFARRSFAKSLLFDEKPQESYIVGRTSRGGINVCRQGVSGRIKPGEDALSECKLLPDAFRWIRYGDSI